MRKQVTCCLLSTVMFVVAAWWISPFFDLKKNPAFNSDSALVLMSATERLPLSENIFQWGGARNGFALAALGKLFFRVFGPVHLIDFLGIVNTLLFVIGCSTFISTTRAGGKTIMAVPAALLLVLPNFYTGLSPVTFAFTVTDVAHRPEAVPILVIWSWMILSLGDQLCGTRRWWVLLVTSVILGVIGAWVSELAVVAGIIFGGIAFCRAATLRQRYPWETLLIWFSSVAGLQILRSISIYGSWENRQLYRLVDREMFQRLLGTAIVNLWSTLSPATWVTVIICFTVVLTILVVRPVAMNFDQSRTAWQCLSLLSLGAVALILPLGNNWVFENGAHLRYFSAGSLLLCIGVAQGAAVLLRHPPAEWTPPILRLGVIGLCLVPAGVTGMQTVAVRRSLNAIDESVSYRASRLVAASGARAVLGHFWNSYAYVLAAPGVLKASATDDGRTSRINTLRVLGTAPIAWIEADPAQLLPTRTCRGVEFSRADAGPPNPLPSQTYFSLYLPTGKLNIDCGRGEYRIYFRDGWSGDESNATHSWRWAVGKRSTIEVPLQKQLNYKLKIVATAAPGLAEPQEMLVVSNAKFVGKISLGAGERISETVILPASPHFPRSIEFQFAEALTPPPRAEGEGDPRPLAVAFEELNFSVAE